jgi:KipI family sensor histidine kinase inhibitor
VFEQLGDRAIRFVRPADVSASSIVRAVKAWSGVADVVVARDHVAAYFDRDPLEARTEIALAIAELSQLRGIDESARTVELRAVYDGEDLATVAGASGLTVDEVVRRHAAATYTVETMGFAPGFAYMTGLDAALVLPRRATPRTRVPAGSIAIAGEHTAVYPFDSPGGWHLLGHVVGVRMFDGGALLQLGDRVRFVEGA